jgi:esterase/lipase superfamily enzyme
MEYKVYGDRGRPVLVFPTSNGRFYQYEDSGMIEELKGFIDGGRVQIWTVDGIDWETFFSRDADFSGRIERHQAYFRYISDEVLPKMAERSREANGGAEILPLLTGCSMGAFHATNFLLRFPWLGDGLIALSGIYSTRHFFGDRLDGSIYFNSPLDYLAGLKDDSMLQQLRRLRVTICCGRGAWEGEMLKETRALEALLRHKSIPALVDYWGEDVSHDWVWWRRQMPYFLGKWLEG